MAQLVFSLLSLKLFVLPYAGACSIIIYTLDKYIPPLKKNLDSLSIANYDFYILDSPSDIDFAESLENCSEVDRICVRRMLADFRVLPVDSFRLLLGNDIYFFSPPQEIISWTFNLNPSVNVLYMIDDFFFKEQPYKLRYYRPEILGGLLGDFYCIAPGVSLERTSIVSCLRLIDDWPPYRRWIPELPRHMTKMVHACEQQAAAMLLGQFVGKALPSSLYNNYVPRKNCVVLHTGHPWLNISLGQIPPELASQVLEVWKQLGYHHILEAAKPIQINRATRLYREIKQFLWRRYRR